MQELSTFLHRVLTSARRTVSLVCGCHLITFSNPQFDCFRLILVLPATGRIFTERSPHAQELPRLSIPRWSRVAEQIQAVIEQRWGFKSVVVDLLEEGPAREAIAIAELRGVSETGPLPPICSWVDLCKLSQEELDGASRTIVERLLNDGTTGRGCFSRFGWIEEALDWISEEAGVERAQFTEEVKQFNAAADSALVRFGRKSGPPMWFKASGGPLTHEYRLTSVLSQLLPGFLPAVVATREDWHAWWMEDAGQPLDSARSADSFGQAVFQLAEIQKGAAHLTPLLLSGGCSDQRLPVLRANIPPMLDSIASAMARRDEAFVPRFSLARIRELEEILTEACLCLESLGIAHTLLHGDISFENILVGPRGCVVTDWATAAIGNPFVTFEQLRAQIEQDKDVCAWLPGLTEIYRRSWLDVLNVQQIDSALALAPPIAAMTYFFEQWKRRGSGHGSDREFRSYIRVLARQIDYAAHDLACSPIRYA